jgi:predicted ATPase/class 3 adenylate cyclase/Tfp pilus assembly protein PilF
LAGSGKGILTFLLTDVEGSSHLWERAPASMSKALARHDEILATQIGAHDGTVIKPRGEGDSAFAVFQTPGAAVAAALSVQRALLRETWPAQTALHVRIAIHSGPAELRAGDYYGLTVNRCARLRAAAHGGQVLLSSSARELVSDDLPEGATLKDLGSHRLKDLSRPERIFQLLHSSLEYEFAPLACLDPERHNLPIQLTSFIGREDEMAVVRKLLSSSRLVTLCGTGGVGKTRLGLQVVSDVSGDYADGAWLVELGALAAEDLVPGALASALGLREEPERPLIDVLQDFLRERCILVVLDNCEHVVGACAKLADSLLHACPEMSILATSREPLRIPGEAVFRVPSLAAPTADHESDPEALSDFEAVRLFVDRAHFVNPGFSLTPDNSAAVAAICRSLDGIPLAIELAAARLSVLSPAQIADRLTDRFGLLTGGPRTVLPRHQTLTAAVDWSYELLNEAEQLLLHGLSVFAGGFTLDAAENVCGGGLEGFEVLDLLTELVQKSLVSSDEEENEPRYRLLETIRQYAAGKLAAAGAQRVTSAAHSRWFLALADRASRGLHGSAQRGWLDRLDREHDNIRAAVGWAAGEDGDPDMALELVAALTEFWHSRGYWTEGRRHIEDALSRQRSRRDEPTARALTGASTLARAQGDYAAARELGGEALSAYREAGDVEGVAAALHSLGAVAGAQGDYAAARTLCEEALATHRALGKRYAAARVLSSLANISRHQHDPAAARAMLDEALLTFRDAGDKAAEATALLGLGNVLVDEENHAAARPFFEQALTIRRELGHKVGVANSLNNLGVVAIAEQQFDDARPLFEEALEIRREIGDKAGIAEALGNLGDVARQQGDFTSARPRYEDALAIFREIGAKRGVGQAIFHLASMAPTAAAARTLYHEALEIHQELGDKRVVALCVEALAD